MHSDKEIKIQNQYYPDASSYYFGKLNSMQVFRAGVGILQDDCGAKMTELVLK